MQELAIEQYHSLGTLYPLIEELATIEIVFA